MRKLIILATIVALAPAVAMARGGNHPMAGCGLGYMLFPDANGRTGMQILATTTNGTSYSQTFGITSGTSGCTEGGAVSWTARLSTYTEVNFAQIQREIAVGDGEYVGTFADLLGAKNKAEMVKFLHKEYKTIFPTERVTPREMLNTVFNSLSQHPELL